ncbi:MAG: FliA/WhiG family RNA polymerase sigma factor [Sphingomonadaceae bacterium]|uniref:sigma-70 family RNA polymerase sigma factor n=1 Tax=Thermaurantiacus sp. TaxID=2820283 RepID=UPI00298F0D5B|nr:FliA/WhiG family RNA polymerase sigma factor [Thermaurantiacus sp.]MCS6986827.1 FliA/WhiG family RNA polymerase sigma factor [Sphingomonadaceae bacterium]MDW8413910.1 FliA/WhiG family RNA polymerase sigma factor [Thermaurantiacus sp.]
MDARLGLDPGVYSPSALARTDPERLIQNHLALVRKIAWHVHARVSSAIDIEELVQIGIVALIEAAHGFEDRGHAAFSTYATVRIRGALIDALRKHATLCRSALRRRRELNAARERLEGRLGRPPTEAELAGELGIGVAELAELVSATQAVRHESMDEVYSDHSLWFASDEPDAFARLESEQLKRQLAEAIATLPPREAMVLQLYFVEELNLEEIGRVLGVGAARVCQIKKAALQKVRKMLGGWED